MELVALPAFTDNYIWMLHDGSQAVVVDPGVAEPVMQVLQQQGLRLAGILVTHHHADHIGGVDALRPLLQGPVIGPKAERTTACDRLVGEGDHVSLLGLDLRVIDVPGHTLGHIAYHCAIEAGASGVRSDHAPVVQAEASGVLFCGDTLFSAGCGRLFEGTPAQMKTSLDRLGDLPPDTRVCCAHEYTLSNLRFALAVEPGNRALQRHAGHCQALRAAQRPTLPSSIALERSINPFLRCSEPEVIAAAQAHGAADTTPTGVFAALRKWKDSF